MKIEAKSDSEDIRVYIDNILHLRIPRDKNIKIQSWIEGHSKSYTIEILVKNNQIKIAYDSKTKWEKVLKLLDEHI